VREERRALSIVRPKEIVLRGLSCGCLCRIKPRASAQIGFYLIHFVFLLLLVQKTSKTELAKYESKSGETNFVGPWMN
jgi:hypothetical protein